MRGITTLVVILPLHILTISAQVHHSEIIFPGHYMPKIIKCTNYLKNNAREIYTENFTIKSDSLILTGYSKLNFDSVGILKEEFWLVVPGNGEKKRYHYDSIYQLTFKNRFSGKGETWDSFKYTYDEKGRLNEIKQFLKLGELGHITKVYYQADTMIIREMYETSIVVGNDYAKITPLTLDSKKKDFYKKGLLIKSEDIDSKGGVWRTMLYDYDLKDRCIGTSSWSYGRKRDETQYNLDEHGNILQLIYIADNKTSVGFIQRFDNHRITYKKHRFELDEIEELWSYNEQGDKVRYQKIVNDKLVEEEKTDYEYDTYSNWIKKVVRLNGALKSIITRKIRY